MTEIGSVSREQAAPGTRPGAADEGGRPRARAKCAQAPGGTGEIEARIASLNGEFASLGVYLRFRLSREDSNVVILVIDEQTGDVIRQIPPEYFLRASARGPRGAGRGLLVDEGL